MNAFYYLILFFLILVAYAGIEETLRLVKYIDLQIKYLHIKILMYRMKKRLEKDLNLPKQN
jgi:hypothetical protein